MNKHKAKKHFGQNFLTDKNLLKKIIVSAKIENKHVIEIGPGKGALTQFLVTYAKSVTAYEIDDTLRLFLNKLEKANNNLEVIYKDILNINIPDDKEYDVVANIPYNITSPIIFKLIEAPNILSATLMVQKEVAERITSKPNNKAYNSLSVIVQYYMEVEKIMIVKRNMFKPQPNVDSAVFKMSRRKPVLLSSNEEEVFIKIVKGAFIQKRKTLVNNWIASFGFEKEKLNMFLKHHDISKLVRAENISLQQFVTFAKHWDDINNQ